MAVNKGYKDYVVDQLSKLSFVTVKKMFGGAGIHHDGLIFGLLGDDDLYFKADDSNKSDLALIGKRWEPLIIKSYHLFGW